MAAKNPLSIVAILLLEKSRVLNRLALKTPASKLVSKLWLRSTCLSTEFVTKVPGCKSRILFFSKFTFISWGKLAKSLSGISSNMLSEKFMSLSFLLELNKSEFRVVILFDESSRKTSSVFCLNRLASIL